MSEPFDKHNDRKILKPEDVAQYLRKSLSWVYKNWEKLGGVKIGGSIFFQSKEALHEHLFRQKQGVEVRFQPKQATVHRSMVPVQKRGKAGRSGTKGGNFKSAGGTGGGLTGDPNRHNLLGSS